MSLFTKSYQKLVTLAGHPKASYYLAGLSITEAIFFPIPPDVMLAPMVLTKPENAWRYAGLTTFSSVLGGLVGYLLGMFLFSMVQGWLQYMGYESAYLQAQQWFLIWGFWVIIIKAFTPIPYKILTIAAGAAAMPLLPFILGSIIGRGARFYLLSGIVRWGGRPMERVLLRYIEWIGWLCIAMLLIYLAWRFLFHSS